MIVIDDPLLAEFRRKPRCEKCKAMNRCDIHPHHMIARGMGGGRRLDHRYNLIALCFRCHQKFHDGNIPRSELWTIIETREKLPPESAESLCWEILRSS